MIRGTTYNNFFQLGTVPTNENHEYYNKEKSYAECERLISQLRKEFGEEPIGVKLVIVEFPSEKGMYSMVICKFEEDKEDALNYASNINEKFPTNWKD